MPSSLAVQNARQSAQFLPNTGSFSQWPEKMLRTYLWAMGIEPESTIPEDLSLNNFNCGHISFATSSTPASPTSPSFGIAHGMAQNSLFVCLKDVGSMHASQRHPFLIAPRLRHSASCDLGLRPSLPTSPRQPRLIPQRSASPLRPVYAMKHTDATADTIRQSSDKTARKQNALLKRPPVLEVVPAPTIILSPPTSSCTSPHTFASSISASSSGYPSRPASSVSDDCDSTSTLSESSYSSGHREGRSKCASYANIMESFRETHPNEPRAPSRFVSEIAFDSVAQSQSDHNFIVFDESEHRGGLSQLTPGSHGWVFPCRKSLAEILVAYAQYGSESSLFVRRCVGSQARYQYLGIYRIVRKSIHSDGVNEVKTREMASSWPVFLKFLSYDWKLSSFMESVDNKSCPQGRRNENLTDSFHTGSFQQQVRRKSSRAHVRIVTVDGMDFEMTPSPIAWDHGSFRDA
ncbi:uncharacterized protein FOMMEDRAFT_18406 [Fomitiporia mediterranea MF3/22]|uniref:uncharacterized protein n=1 Tax=Fomitiporia mediterranea (strain MF3/22) TaxID=694068 RepID=UPI0004409913|nr:uncharacterized protein FOMMEDRAFT_18406 [Fomitiporia mediterranea MF3/22]EJD06261.1 hypothetical protein FOMMEDRAFT_18406 [Fomitiporia mediterranea MF3/22]